MATTTTDVEARPMVQVWDIGVRLFHWSLVAMVLATYFIVDPRSVHRGFGYAVVALIGFRLIWGVIGGRHARFADFVPNPVTLIRYLGDMLRGREARYLGHNPAGAAMILVLLSMLAAITVTGYMMGLDAYFGKEWVEDAHKMLVNGLFLLIPLHVGGVVLSGLRHRENLVLAMVHGNKDVDITDAPH